MTQLSLNNVVSISLSATPRGLGEYNTSNLAIFTTSAPSSAFDEGYRLYLSASEVATDFTSGSHMANLANTIFSQSPNILTGGGYLAVISDATTQASGLSVASLNEWAAKLQFFGLMSDTVNTDDSIKAVGSAVQSLNKVYFAASKSSSDLTATTGIADAIRLLGYDKTRVIARISQTSNDDASNQVAAYASRGLSTNFAGSNTTQTMHLKDLTGVTTDGSITQTLFTNAQTGGADLYPSFQGLPKVQSNGANGFFDDVYNRTWFAGALEIAGFNYLAQSSNKIPQTEEGMSGLKGAYRRVCEQAVTNQYIAPGTWTSSDTFGNLADFHRNIEERGYYIYSTPIADQSAASRAAREATVVQIAIKAAGAIHSTDVLVYVNQ